jgi:hypothetical protein
MKMGIERALQAAFGDALKEVIQVMVPEGYVAGTVVAFKSSYSAGSCCSEYQRCPCMIMCGAECYLVVVYIQDLCPLPT